MDALAKFIETLGALGPYGLLVAALVIGLCVALILVARSKDVLTDKGTSDRMAAFQADLLREQGRLRERERLLEEQIEQLQAQVDLYREQTRRLIDQLRLVQAGRMAVSNIEIPERLA